MVKDGKIKDETDQDFHKRILFNIEIVDWSQKPS